MFEYNGFEFTYEEVEAKAKEKGLDIDTYISKYGINKIDTPSEEGKQLSQGPGAPAAETQAPTVQGRNIGRTMGSQPEDTSLDSQKQDELIREGVTESISQAVGGPKSLVSTAAQWTSFFARTGAGVIDAVERLGAFADPGKAPILAAAIANKDSEAIQQAALATTGGLDLNNVYEFADSLDVLKTKKYDKDGKEMDVVGLVSDGRIGDAAELAVSEAVGSAPSLAITYAMPAVGSAILGLSTTGQEFEKAVKERPEATVSKIYTASLSKGLAEFGSEYVGGKLFQGISKLKGVNAPEKLIKDFTGGYLKKSLAATGWGFLQEGATEGITDVLNKATDELVFDDEYETKDYVRGFINSAIIGGILGGAVTGAGRGMSIANTKADKQGVYNFIAPKNVQQDIFKINQELAVAKSDLEVASPNKKKFFQNKVDVLQQKIDNRNDVIFNKFESMTDQELNTYAESFKSIDDNMGIVMNPKYSQEAKEAAKKEIDKAYSDNKNLFGDPEFYNEKVEKSITENLKNTEEILKQFNKLKGVNKNDLEVKQINQQEAAELGMKDVDGFFIKNDKTGKKQIFINVEAAAKTGQRNVVGHEALHYIMSKQFKVDNESMKPLVDSFKDYLSEVNPKALQRIEERLEANYKDPETNELKEGAQEEYFNIFSDLVQNGEITIRETGIEKIKSTANRFLTGLGFKTVKLDTGKDVYNFIKDYNKNVNLSGEFIGKSTITKTKISSELLSGLDTKAKEAEEKSAVDEIVRKSSSDAASEKVQKIFDEQGVSGAFEIVEEYKGMASKIANIYRERPGFETYKEDLIDGILNDPTYGVLGLTLKYKPEENKGVPLAAYINKYLRSRSITLANQLLGKDEASTFKSDVTEVKDVTATETAEDAINVSEEIAKEKPKAKKKLISEQIIFNKELDASMNDALVKGIALNINKFDIETTKNRTITPFIADLKKDLSDFLEKDLVKFIKSEGLDQFLSNNREVLLDNLTTTFLSKHPFFRKGILKRVNGEWVAPTKISAYKYDWIDSKGDKLKIDRDNAAGRGMTSGPEFIKRNPKIKEIVKENEFIDYHFQDGALRNKAKQNPVASIARQIAAEKGFEILKADLLSNGELTQKIKERADLYGIIIAETEATSLANDIDRGIAKLSISKANIDNIIDNSSAIMFEFSGKNGNDLDTFKSVLSNYVKNESKKDFDELAKFLYEGINKFLQPLINVNTPPEEAFKVIQSDFFNNLTVRSGIVSIVGGKNPKMLDQNGLTEIGDKLNNFFVDYLKNKILNKSNPKEQLDEIINFLNFTSRTIRNNSFLETNLNIEKNLLKKLFKNKELSYLKRKIILNPKSNTLFYLKDGIKTRVGIPTEYNISEKTRQYKIAESYVNGYNSFSDKASEILYDQFVEIKKTGDINLFKAWASIQNQSRSLLRLAANLVEVDSELDTDNKNTVWEHKTPASEIMRLFAANFISENLVTNEQLKNELNRYEVALVNKDIDDALTENGRKEITGRKNIEQSPSIRYKETLSKEQLNRLVKVNLQDVTIKQSNSMNSTFNEMLERKKGILATETISKATAKLQGQNKGKFKVFVPPSADDFVGLIYNFLGTGKQGDADMQFFEDNLLRPLAEANRNLNLERQSIKQKWQEVVKANKGITKLLRKENDYKFYTNDHAVRAWVWNKLGYDIPGISETDKASLIESINSNEKLLKFAEELIDVPNKKESWLKPEQDWTASTVELDLQEILSKIGRARIFDKFITNADIIFSEANLNKVEAAYGPNLRSALDDMLYRIKTGRAREIGNNKLANAYLNWVRGSVATTMFFNTRTSLLQQLSIVNFTNWNENNPIAQGKFLMGSPRIYAKYWAGIFNSDWMKERRQGLKTDINESELVARLEGSKNKNKALLAYILEKGFSLTKYGDNIAIATGGAPFLYNREQKYIKEGMTEAKAKEEAFLDFQELAERTQQSSRQDLLSNQQVSITGRLFLAFQNTTMQMTRIQKKSALDIINKRGDFKTNISRLVYYSAIQNTLFAFFQNTLFAAIWADEDDEDLKLDDKTLRAANTVLDSALRGSGIGGAILATLKNAIIAWNKENDKGWKADNSKVLLELLNVSPAIGIKARKFNTAMNAYKYGKSVIDDVSYTNPNHPYYGIAGSLTSATFNIPIDRIITKAQNLRALTNQEAEAWQRTALFLGYNSWDLGLKDEEIELAKARDRFKSKKPSVPSNSRKTKRSSRNESRKSSR